MNSGTAPAEEAAAWVEYCNGPVTTPMGSLRAKNGHAEPYNIRIWEVGNENFGYWQGGYVGSEENARRFAEFATAMRSASPIAIELIACGSNFDFAQPGADFDHVTADRRWHDSLLESAPEPRRFPVVERSICANDGVVTVSLPPSSVAWIRS